jgi:ubiquitin-conjugating enzyme E2 S
MTTGAICVNTLKKDWSAETTFSHILSVIRCLLIYPFPESSLNDEAGKLFMESYDEYSKRARLMADVHGRTDWTNKDDSAIGEDNHHQQTRKSDSKNDEDSDDGDSPQRQKTRIDPTSSTPLTNKDSTNNIAVNNSSTAKAGKSMGQKQPSAHLTKKKSLKRL